MKRNDVYCFFLVRNLLPWKGGQWETQMPCGCWWISRMRKSEGNQDITMTSRNLCSGPLASDDCLWQVTHTWWRKRDPREKGAAVGYKAHHPPTCWSLPCPQCITGYVHYNMTWQRSVGHLCITAGTLESTHSRHTGLNVIQLNVTWQRLYSERNTGYKEQVCVLRCHPLMWITCIVRGEGWWDEWCLGGYRYLRINTAGGASMLSTVKYSQQYTSGIHF